jgi:hypothetical protein
MVDVYLLARAVPIWGDLGLWTFVREGVSIWGTAWFLAFCLGKQYGISRSLGAGSCRVQNQHGFCGLGRCHA